jgi:hypothetical protein
VERQRLVADYIAFLKNVDPPVISGEITKPTDLMSEPFLGLWKDRQDLADSSEWVRNVRQSEW